jgi:hypothetical protein
VLQTIYNQLSKPLVKKRTKLVAADWSALFECLSLHDFAGLYGAFLKAFYDAYQQPFRQMRPTTRPCKPSSKSEACWRSTIALCWRSALPNGQIALSKLLTSPFAAT